MSEQQGQGTISAENLMMKLVQAKKVMNKVDSGNFEKGHVNENIIMNAPEDIDTSQLKSNPTRPVSGPLNIDRINNSKLPENIKKAMRDHPIQQMPSISLNESLDMNIVEGAKRLMEQEGVQTKKSIKQNTTSMSSNMDMNMLATLVENTVRKVLDEKLNQILTAQQTQTINENLVLKVGDSVFKGKITGVNKAK